MESIVKTLEEIAALCAAHGSDDWAGSFRYFVEQVKKNEWDSAKRKILSVYTGMGSFNDLVLHENGKPLGKANDSLEKFRESLYKQVTDNW